MSSLNTHLKNLNKQHGGSGIPISEIMKQKKNLKEKLLFVKNHPVHHPVKEKLLEELKKEKFLVNLIKKKDVNVELTLIPVKKIHLEVLVNVKNVYH